MPNTNNYRTLDARHLLPPEPMEQVLQILPSLTPGETLRMLIHREPVPLYGILTANGFTYTTKPLDNNNFEVLISRAS